MKFNYDAAVGAYAKHRQPSGGILERLRGLGRLSAKSRVLEVGSGSGNYISALSDTIGCQCFGLEPSEGMLATARARNSAISWTRGQAEALPYPADLFDLVFCVDVIHHLADLDSFTREAFRVLRPPGTFCIVTDSDWTIRNRNPLSLYFPETVEKELERYPTIERLRFSLLENGFGDINDEIVELPQVVEKADAYREKAFSCLHLISAEAHARGMFALCEALSRGPIHSFARYALVYAKKN